MKKIILDIADVIKGPPLMTGDLGWDEFADTVSPLGLANLAPLGKAPIGTFRYIRIHNIFTGPEGDGRGERDAGGQPVQINDAGEIYYDWTIIDKVIQAILDVNCIPFLELGFTPTQWSSIPDDEKVELKENLTSQDKYRNPLCSYPPKDYALWEDLINSFLTHIKEKFGEGVKQWPVELWNEPDISYFRGTPEQYFDLWKITYSIAKKHDMVTVGGPGVARVDEFLTNFLQYSIDNDCKPDYVSYHVKGGKNSDGSSVILPLWAKLLQGRDIIHEFYEFRDYSNTPIVITEMDPMVGCEYGIPDDPKWVWRNTSYYASWLGKICYLFASMQRSWEYEGSQPDDEIGPFRCDAQFNDAHHVTAEKSTFYGARCLTTPVWIKENDKVSLKSLEKPIFRAFEYTRFLRGEFIPFLDLKKNVFGVIAIDNDMVNICVVLHDDKMNETPLTKIHLQINGFEYSKIQLKNSARIDKESANPFDLWKEMGSPEQISVEQWEKLQEASKVKPARLKKMYLKQFQFELQLEMVGHSFNFIQFQLYK
jgi:xylan 1,4-beta-xylosidase